MKKILYISTNSDEAGAPRHVETLVVALSGKYQVFCIFGEAGPVMSRLVARKIPVMVVNELRNKISPINDFISLAKVILFVVQNKISILHCHSAKAAMIGRLAATLSNTACVCTIHGWGWRGMSFLKGWLVKTIENILWRICRSDYIFVSKSVMAEAIAEFGESRSNVYTIYNGIPDIPFELLRCQRRNLCDPKVIKIIMPARVCSAKDHRTILMAFQKLDSRYRLLLCGNGTQNVEFKEAAEKIVNSAIHRVEFIGETSEIDSYYRQADIFVLVSNFEALPISIIEAMGFGLPIIASNVGGNSELLVDGESGFLIPPKDVNGLIERIKILESPEIRFQMGSNARKRFEKNFGVDSMAKKVGYCYDRLLGFR